MEPQITQNTQMAAVPSWARTEEFPQYHRRDQRVLWFY